MWDKSPWAIGADVENSVQVARTLAFLAMQGHEGVVGPADCRVVPFDVPGAGVNVLPGVVGVLSKVEARQAYVGRNPTVDTQPIAATGSAGARSDMIVARALDPEIDEARPTGAPADQFMVTDVIPNVPSTARTLADAGRAGLNAVPLALVTLPANTQTVTAGMIRDLRTLANPQSRRDIYPGTLNGQNVTTISNGWRAFPPSGVPGITIPPWATHAAIRVATTMQYVSGDPTAVFQAFLGPAGQQDDVTLFSTTSIDTVAGGGGYRQSIEITPDGGVWSIPASLRGKSVQISSRVKGKVSGGVLRSPSEDYYYADITWQERLQ